MKIERIRSVNTGLGEVDWTFLAGPILIFSEDRSRYRMLGDLLIKLFYEIKTPLPSQDQGTKGLVEVWMAESSAGFHIRREFIQQGDDLERFSFLEIEDETGAQVILPETTTLGEFLFRVKLQAFRQGAIVEWPESNECDTFPRLVRNLREGGDEEFSLTKVRASLVGAQKRVKEQTESMMLVKAEYDALRAEWETAYRQQEESRLRVIEIRNLREKEAILAERIITDEKIQVRLALLRQNLDYRELRQLQVELARLEGRSRESESNLTALTRESQVDWAVIESLHEECIEWAFLQEQVRQLSLKAQMRAETIKELENLLQTSGYQGLAADYVQNLRRTEEERDAAQEELVSLTNSKNELEEKQKLFSNEVAILQEYAVMAGVTDAAEIKVAQRERRLAQWQNSKIGSFFDRILQSWFAGTGIGERLSIQLIKYYHSLHVSNYKEFTIQLKKYRNQRRNVKKIQIDLDQLQEKVSREENIRRILHSRDKTLKQAFARAKAEDFTTWLNGWEDYWRKKSQLSVGLDEQQLELAKLEMKEKKMATSAAQLREKLENWGTLATDRDEVLAAVLKVASQLRVKDEAERELAEFSKRYHDLLGDRNIENLAKVLEPLADLEREIHLSKEDGLVELMARQQERVETRGQLAAAEQRLQRSSKFPALSVLEKKIEIAKQQWMAYEDLQSALDDALDLLETSSQEWQIQYGKVLNEEKQWIFSQISSSQGKRMIERDGVEAKRNYFAYRMAIAQLALHDNTELPLIWSVGEMNEGQSFREEVTGYLRKLSLSRQVVLSTSDPKLFQELAATEWQRIVI